MKLLPSKSATEIVPITLQFGDELAEGETLVTPTVTLYALKGLDANPNARVLGTPQVMGSDVFFTFQNGVLAEDYFIVGKVTTSNNQTLELAAVQPIRDLADI